MNVNKYFIGFEIPFEQKLKLTKAQMLVTDMIAPTTRVLSPDELHVTSLFLGKCPRSAAEDICNQLAWSMGSIYFRMVQSDVFGKHALVVLLHDLYGNAELMHNTLKQAALRHQHISLAGKRYPYNPHTTLAKCEGPPDPLLDVAKHAINTKMNHNVNGNEFHCDHLVLFEKAEGASTYEPHRMLQLR